MTIIKNFNTRIIVKTISLKTKYTINASLLIAIINFRNSHTLTMSIKLISRKTLQTGSYIISRISQTIWIFHKITIVLGDVHCVTRKAGSADHGGGVVS